jgi:stage IV sporulation protein FB
MADEQTRKPVRPHPHPWSLQIATVAGIPIRLHFTFFLGLIYFGLLGGHGFNWSHVALVVALFICVVLHELGHSLVALRYKIPVADITLYPIGGVASIEKRPAPVQEFWIALAGPAVNVVIAAALWFVLGKPDTIAALNVSFARHFSIAWIWAMNIWLVIFNAIPAFPMDGGRVLRAILAMNIPAERATSIAAGLGQLIAIVFGILSLYIGSVVLMFIAFFIYVGASQEATAYHQAAMIEGIRASQAMMTDVRTLSVGDTLKDAADVLLATSQHDFPVVHGDVVQGILTRNGLLRGLAEEGPTAYVAGVMDRDFASVAPDDELAEALSQMEEDQAPVLVLDPKDEGKLLGLISGENVAEFFAVRRIVAARNGWAT